MLISCGPSKCRIFFQNKRSTVLIRSRKDFEITFSTSPTVDLKILWKQRCVLIFFYLWSFLFINKKKKIALCVCVCSLSHAVGFVWAVWKISKSEICSDFIFGLNRNRVLFRSFLAWTLLSRAQNRFVATILRVDRQIDLLLVCLLCLSRNALYSNFRADFVWIELYVNYPVLSAIWNLS